MSLNEIFLNLKDTLIDYASQEEKLTHKQIKEMLNMVNKFEEELIDFFGCCSAENFDPKRDKLYSIEEVFDKEEK